MLGAEWYGGVENLHAANVKPRDTWAPPAVIRSLALLLGPLGGWTFVCPILVGTKMKSYIETKLVDDKKGGSRKKGESSGSVKETSAQRKRCCFVVNFTQGIIDQKV